MATKVKIDDMNDLTPGVPVNELDKSDLGLEKSEKREKSRNAKKGGKTIWIIVFLVLVVIGAVTAAMIFNFFGLRDKTLGVFTSLPIIGNLVHVENEELDDPYAGLSRNELVIEIEKMKLEVEEANTLAEQEREAALLKTDELLRLQEIEKQHTDFIQERDEFNRKVVEGDTAAYIDYFESIPREEQEELYSEISEEQKKIKELKNYVATYSVMSPKNAAKIFEELVNTDIELVVYVMQNMGTDSRGAILAAMTPQSAATVTRMIAPEE